jgi:hypothetical protein
MQVMETERQTQGVMVVAVVVLLKMGIGVVVLHVVQRKPKYLLTCLMERIQRGVLLAMVLMRDKYGFRSQVQAREFVTILSPKQVLQVVEKSWILQLILLY